LQREGVRLAGRRRTASIGVLRQGKQARILSGTAVGRCVRRKQRGQRVVSSWRRGAVAAGRGRNRSRQLLGEERHGAAAMMATMAPMMRMHRLAGGRALRGGAGTSGARRISSGLRRLLCLLSGRCAGAPRHQSIELVKQLRPVIARIEQRLEALLLESLDRIGRSAHARYCHVSPSWAPEWGSPARRRAGASMVNQSLTAPPARNPPLRFNPAVRLTKTKGAVVAHPRPRVRDWDVWTNCAVQDFLRSPCHPYRRPCRRPALPAPRPSGSRRSSLRW